MTGSETVASCDGLNEVRVLVRERTATTTAWSYRLRTCTPAGATTDTGSLLSIALTLERAVLTAALASHGPQRPR